ncbi:polymorphic toxin-type HINT domain-containing protein [Streptomyces sp. NPDC056670]|uniref:polymorphic toxin-type HINT domain-containing protein n=1 Tax=Streptomyces sp. NPDC056670 TaxID=3345904 RepID=UPI0036B9C7CC
MATLLSVTPVQAAPSFAPPEPSRVRPVDVAPVARKEVRLKNDAPGKWQPPRAAWPSSGSQTVDVRAGAGAAKAGSLPIWLSTEHPPQVQAPLAAVAATASSPVSVDFYDKATADRAGVNGVVFSADSPQKAQVDLDLDYRSFAGLYGGGWASRLHLVQLPACALSTPQLAQCRTQTPLTSQNRSKDGHLTAPVEVARQGAGASLNRNAALFAQAQPMVLAAAAGTSGGGGDFGATPLAAAGTWNAGGSSGDFTFSYPIEEPPVPGGLAPDIALGYSAQSVDGRMSGGNSQAGWIGDGWSYEPGSISRTYQPCADDPAGTAAKVQDNCWAGQLMHISLAGHSGDLVYDASKPQKWHVSNEAGEKVEYLTDTVNGTTDNGYWKITSADGTQYFFGLNRPKGWAAGKTETNSAWTVPVYGAHSGDPCYQSSGFANSRCDQAWQWNLDYVVDRHGNAMTYYYNKETNYYGANKGSTGIAYTRGGAVDRIEYGFTDGNAYTGSAPAKVVFETGDRCFAATCNPLSSNKGSWPDVPYDLNCDKGASCANHSPSFWTTRRLDKIRTQTWDAGTMKYADVDSWQLKQSYPPVGDNSEPSLWLDSIQRTGLASGGNLPLPETTFTRQQLANRYNTGNGYPNFTRFRISGIVNESGAATSVNYSSAQCDTKAAPSANTSRCYPVYWTPPGEANPILDWFNKYLVSTVTENDPTGGSPGKVTAYTYLGDAGWHYDDNELTKPKYRTWGQWRGYPRVQTRVGETNKTLTETLYYRGLDGDTLPGGKKRSSDVTLLPGVTVPGADATVADREELTGQVRESLTYDGDGGTVAKAMVNDYWVSSPTASRSRAGLDPVNARMVRPQTVRATQAITSTTPTTWRTTRTDSAYDKTTGATLFVQNSGDITKPEQITCTASTYATPNTTTGVKLLIAEVETLAAPCGTTGDTSNGMASPSDVDRSKYSISDVRTFYDTAPPGTWPPTMPSWPQAAPATGDVTLIAEATGYANSAYSYQVKAAEQFDATGRTVAAWNSIGAKGTTEYTLTGGLTTSIKTGNALGQYVTSTIDPQRGNTLAVVDANGGRTEATYDALGRTTAMWSPGRLKSAGKSANATFAYQISPTASSVTTKSLNEDGTYATTVQIYDAQLRPRQTQKPTPMGGRLLSDVTYDSLGRQIKTNNGYWDASTAPNATLVTTSDANVPSQSVTTYDGQGRTLTVQDSYLGKEDPASRVTNVYGGDRTTTIPPQGATPVTTITDAIGRTTEVRHYKTPPTVSGSQVTAGDYITTSYAYDRLGRQTSITDPGNNVRSYEYDFLGRKSAQTDPDAGRSTLTYYPDGKLQSTTDAEGRSTAYGYDPLGRKTSQHNGKDTAAPKTASWTFDDPAVPNSIGHLTSATRYDNGLAYTQATTKFTVSGQPLQTKVSIPSKPGEEALAADYVYDTNYSPNTELPNASRLPAAGGLAQEVVTQGYNQLGQPTTVGGSAAFTTATDYDAYGRVSQTTLGAAGKRAVVTLQYDAQTGAVNQVATDTSTQTGRTDQVDYTRDPAGNITSITNKRSGGTVTDTQCFANDLLGRLVQAWTATDSCAVSPSAAGPTGQVGGYEPYWTTWDFDNVGNQTKKVDHAVGGAVDKTTTTTFAYGRPGAAGEPVQQPDTLTGTSTVAEGVAGSTGTSYTYDKAGNTKTRTLAEGTDTLTWDGEGKLASLKSTGQDASTGYLYDADGNQLLRRDPNGKTTLYLPGQEVVLDTATKTTTATRYITLPGGETAVRTNANASATDYSYVLSNLQGTGQLTLTKDATNPVWRTFTPYGAPRDGQRPASWPGTKGFVGGTDDQTTGLTLLGAREYDPALGRFISPDPVFSADDPQQMGGYNYAGSSPVTKSDPAGLQTLGGCATAACAQAVLESSHADTMWHAASCTTASCYYSILASDCHCTDSSYGSGPSSYGVSYGPSTKASGGTHGHKKKPGLFSRALHVATHAVDTGAQWVKKHKVAITSFAVSLAVGAACVAGAGAAGIATGGAGFALAAGCGAVAGAASAAVENAMDPNADHSWAGFGKSMLVGAVTGAIGGLAGAGAAKLAAKVVKPLLAKVAPSFKNAVNRVLGRASCDSFLAGTVVVLANGKTKPIEKVGPGDKVAATDPVSGTSRTEPVTDTITHTADKEYTTLTIRTPDGHSTQLKATGHHPYWETKSKRWVNASDLKPGDQLRSADGAPLEVLAVTTTNESHRTFNLTVAELHTYYVLAGAAPVLVHNCNVTAAARAEADAASSIRPSKARPAVAEALELPNGQVYSSPSVRGAPPTLHPIVQDILDAIPVAERGVGHGSCGLAVCVSRALTDEQNPTGSSAAAVIVRGSRDNAMHGHPVGPCDSCVALEDAFDLNFVTAR